MVAAFVKENFGKVVAQASLQALDIDSTIRGQHY